MGREDGRRGHGDVDTIWEDAEVAEIDPEGLRALAQELAQPFRGFTDQAGLAAPGPPDEVIRDPLVHALLILSMQPI
jgi:hypothetical protein